jgi:hypothetical protein
MSIFERLRRVRWILGGGAALRAVVWGLAAAASVLAGEALVDVVRPLSPATRDAMLVVAFAAAAAAIAGLAWRDRRVLALGRVALWIEERFPALEYRLVTALETSNERLLTGPSGRWMRAATTRAALALRLPIAALGGAVVVLAFLPRGAVARVRSPHPGDALLAAARRGAERSRLAPLVARVTPPAYTGQRTTTVDEPGELRPLAGGTVVLAGRGDGRGIAAQLGDESITVRTAGGEWSVTLPADTASAVLRLVDGASRRIVGIEPVRDAPPVVALTAPSRDSVLRAPTGTIALTAAASDDYGIDGAAFEYIISSGEGENFTFRSGTIGAIMPPAPNTRTVTLSATLSLDSLHLAPGDVVHLRAVARDDNTATGPGTGASETRTFRIARAGEYDSVAVAAAPPDEEDKSAISERMLVTLAEALDRRRAALTHDTVVAESRRIAGDQQQLRRAVGDVVFVRLGGDPSGEERSGAEGPARATTMDEMLRRADSATARAFDPTDFGEAETPVVAVNKPLLEAYNAMWDAGTHLELGEPGAALPFMRQALAAIERARQAERLYLRGAPPQIVVDVARARLRGNDHGASSALPVLAGDSSARVRAVRFEAALDVAEYDPRAAADSLLVLRIDALRVAPAFAGALSDAAAAIRRSDAAGASAALARARRALAGAPVVRDSITRWTIAP